jgi:hypothetical protein
MEIKDLSPVCPCCQKPMTKVVPLIYQGDGVATYSCKEDSCDFFTFVNITKKPGRG